MFTAIPRSVSGCAKCRVWLALSHRGPPTQRPMLLLRRATRPVAGARDARTSVAGDRSMGRLAGCRVAGDRSIGRIPATWVHRARSDRSIGLA